jgi:hypothetical protein
MSKIIGYYGEFKNEIIEDLIVDFISNIPENDLDQVLKNLIKSVEPKDNFNPISVVKLQEALRPKQNIEAEALWWWYEINNKQDSWNNCIISDIRAQACIQSMGGWINFCQRVVKDDNGKDLDVFYQKDFIYRFKLYTECPPVEELGIMRGLSEYKPKTIMIGDQKVCRQVLEYNNKKELEYQKKESIIGINEIMDSVVVDINKKRKEAI